jgi:ketosteroid isomerase-like protein
LRKQEEEKMAAHQPEELHQLFAEYFNAGDLDSLLSLYEEGAALAVKPDQVVAGQEAIRTALEGILALKGSMELKTRWVMQSGEIALLSSEWHLQGTDAEGKVVVMDSRSVEVARRQEDGRWLYVADHPFGAV